MRESIDTVYFARYRTRMNNSAEIHERHRRSIRLRGYDYSEDGAYFVTVCTHSREPVFGEIQNGEMRLNAIGNSVKKCWNGIPNHYPVIVLDAFVVTPNHIHGIVVIKRDPTPDSVGAAARPRPFPNTGSGHPQGTSLRFVV